MPPSPEGSALVSPDNFARAESDLYFGNLVQQGAFGAFFHFRELSPIDHQLVIRINRDTLYSAAVFDLDAGQIAITLPASADRFMSMQVIDEDHYTHEVVYDAGRHVISREQIGTRYVVVAVRTLVDPDDPADLSAVHSLQDAIEVEKSAVGSFEIPDWDPLSQRTVRDALVTLATTLPDTKDTFGTKDETDPVRHLIGSANAWGGNPQKDALYLTVVPQKNDGSTVHRLTVGEVPVDGFWSVTVYNSDGYLAKNPQDAYSFNNVTARKGPDGSTTIQFGGADGSAPNCLPITPGWNYTVRLYRPRQEILDGSWTFPEAAAV